VPSNVGLPKFLTPPEIKLLAELKEINPKRTWEQLVEEIIADSVKDDHV
jgi:hypothetical protein